MLDPATDKLGDPWCYLCQVHDGHRCALPARCDADHLRRRGVHACNAELCFFYGDKDIPALVRGKTFLEGWIPVVQYAFWKDGNIPYDIEYFASPLQGEDAGNTVNFVRVRMKNTGTQAATGSFAVALRHSGGDHRYGGSGFSPDWKYAIENGAVTRDGKLTYAFAGAACEASPGVAYERPFSGREQSVTVCAECCLARYRRELKPGDSFAASFKMPRVPVVGAAYNAKVLAADYDVSRTDTVAWWKNLFACGAAFEFPEKCVQDAQRASRVARAPGHATERGPQDADRRPALSRFLPHLLRRTRCWPI